MLRLRRLSTLFPYTTLFRSEVGVGGIVTAARQRDLTGPGIVGALGATDQQRLEPPRPFEQDQGYRGGARPGRGLRLGAEVDRKSTRLNSSHPSISYAVFCLK